MNYIEKMLQDYCPNGVEWKELGEVCNVVTDFTAAGSFASNAKNVKYLKEPDFAQLIRTTDLKSKFQGNKFIYVDEHAFNYLHRVNLNEESLILPNVGNCGEIYYLQPSDLPSDNNVLGPNALLIRSNMADNRYLYHLFLDSKFQSDLEKITSKTGQTKFNKTNLKKILIPIPPLEIQEEIVKILDKFTEYVTELTAELTAELTDRQKQYSFYRDKLLSFEDEVYQVEWKTLGDIAKLKNGKDWKSLSVGDIPVYGSGGAMGEFVSEYAYNKPTVLIPRKGSISNLFYLEKPFWNVDTIYYTEIDESQVVPRYLYYYLTTIDLESMATNPTRPSLTQAILDKIPIPVPSLPIQQRIVQVLDNFDAVCNDLNIGLPKEIELRQKQYEYFREKLLTFTAEGVYPGQWTVDSERGPSDLIRLLQWVFGTIRVELGAICTFTRGNGLQKKDFTEEGYPVIHYGQIYTRYGFSTEKTISFTDQSVFAKLKKAQPDDIVMATTSENVEDVGKAVVWEGIEEVGISGDAYIVKTTQHSRFLNYFFKSIHFQEQKEKKVTGTKVIRINAQDMEKFIIALPSLENQSCIVAILNKFDELTNSISQGLPKEIELRQKQYEYFRDTLLNFPNKYE
ncbi:TPA: restriction endonuclease subunit S [Streptococcus suis]|nr:restriction endonuclease subunit S [Streptococcus suis]